MSTAMLRDACNISSDLFRHLPDRTSSSLADQAPDHKEVCAGKAAGTCSQCIQVAPLQAQSVTPSSGTPCSLQAAYKHAAAPQLLHGIRCAHARCRQASWHSSAWLSR